MQPFNYTVDVGSPFASAVKGYQIGMDIEANRQKMLMQQQAMQQQMIRQQQIDQAYEKVRDPNASAEDYRQLEILLDPQMAKSIRESLTQRTEQQNRQALKSSSQIFSAFRSGRPDIALNYIDQEIAAQRNAGNEPGAKSLETWRGVAQQNPEQAELFFGFVVSELPGGDKVIESVQKLQPTPEPGYRMLTETEVKAKGLPAGSYQISGKGEIKPVGPREPLVNVQVDTRQQQRDALALKELDLPRAREFSDAASSARKLANDSRVISNLLKGAGGGRLVKLTTELQRDLGFDTDRVSANDLVNALATRGAVQIRAPGSGATSDLEFRSYLQAFPSLANSERGRELMAKYAEGFARRSARLADHARKLIREDRYSEEEIARFDNSLGPILGEDFYELARPGRRSGVPTYPGAAPAAAPAPVSGMRTTDDILRELGVRR